MFFLLAVQQLALLGTRTSWELVRTKMCAAPCEQGFYLYLLRRGPTKWRIERERATKTGNQFGAGADNVPTMCSQFPYHILLSPKIILLSGWFPPICTPTTCISSPVYVCSSPSTIYNFNLQKGSANDGGTRYLYCNTPTLPN